MSYLELRLQKIEKNYELSELQIKTLLSLVEKHSNRIQLLEERLARSQDEFTSHIHRVYGENTATPAISTDVD